MRTFLKRTAIALALAGAALVTAGTAGVAGVSLGIGVSDSHHDGDCFKS